jgi:hypothetical protein
VESGLIHAGVPAKKVKGFSGISEDVITGEIERIANSYGKYAGW